MKQVTAYQCEKCKATYEDSEKAEDCEMSHADGFIVTHFWFEPKKHVPSSIQVEWKDAKGESRQCVFER